MDITIKFSISINKSYDYAEIKVNVGTEDEPKYEY